MTDGPGNIVGPVTGLLGAGITLLAAKAVIDKTQELSNKGKKVKKHYTQKANSVNKHLSANHSERVLNNILNK